MNNSQVHPPIATREEWLKARISLLEKEKAATRLKDKANAELRRLPMVKIEKDYMFEGPDGPLKFVDLFDGHQQLIVYHFMFDPEWTEGCFGCTGFVDAIGDLSSLESRDATFALISRAPYAKLAEYKTKRGWNRAWYSSFGSDFNYDFNVTHDPEKAPPEYNYRPKPEAKGEDHGLSVFFRIGDDIYHTYSVYARGTECLVDSYRLLDTTPFGRQEDWEDSPEGWPQKPTYG